MRIATVALISLITAACGSSLPPPNDEWAQAQADLGRAEAGGAPGVPDAKLHLQLAARRPAEVERPDGPRQQARGKPHQPGAHRGAARP